MTQTTAWKVKHKLQQVMLERDATKRLNSLVTTRDLYQCAKCRRQTSPIAATIFASTHLPLRLWFRAIYHLTQEPGPCVATNRGHRP